MNFELIKKILVLINLLCVLMIPFLNRIIDLGFKEEFDELYNFVETIDISTEPSTVLGFLFGLGVICYFIGLAMCWISKPQAKILITIGAIGIMIAQVYPFYGLSIFSIDYAPSQGFRYILFFFTGALVSFLYFEDFIKDTRNDRN